MHIVDLHEYKYRENQQENKEYISFCHIFCSLFFVMANEVRQFKMTKSIWYDYFELLYFYFIVCLYTDTAARCS